jgi:hypothetical protein
MDPYIEGCDLWGDFHYHLIEKIFDAISAALPAGYIARVGKRSYIVLAEEEKPERPFVPDVKVLAPRARRPGSSKGGTTTTAAPAEEVEPISLRAFIDTEFVETFIDIYLNFRRLS